MISTKPNYDSRNPIPLQFIQWKISKLFTFILNKIFHYFYTFRNNNLFQYQNYLTYKIGSITVKSDKTKLF